MSIQTIQDSFPVFGHTNVLHIYQGKNVVFFGDSTIRSLYRDLSRLLQKNKYMSDIELKQEHNHHGLYVNEISIERSGIPGMSNRVDCCRYICKESSTTLYFIHLGTILDAENSLTVEWLQKITECKSIDILIVSCAYPDLSFRRLEILKQDFDTSLQTFISALPSVLTKLNLAFFGSNQYELIKIWISPIPYRILDMKQYQQFTQLIDICLHISNQFKFNQLKRMHPWIHYYKSVYVKESYHLSSTGIRQLTNQIIEIVKEKQLHPSYDDVSEPFNISIVTFQTSIPMINSTVPIQIDPDDEYRKSIMEKRKDEKLQRKILKKEAAKRKRANERKKQKKKLKRNIFSKLEKNFQQVKK